MNLRILLGVLAALVIAGVIGLSFALRGKGEGEFTAVATPAPAPTPVMGESLTQMANDKCSLSPGEPKLRGAKYPGYQIDKGESEFTEKVTLADATKLEVYSSGCEEFITTRLVFQPPASEAKTRSIEQWARWADDKVQTLEANEGAEWMKTEFHDFVQKAEEAKATGEGVSSNSVRVCNDGSLPSEEADCSWEQGGSTEFKIEPSGNSVRVVIEYLMAS